jgi:hypothetical protein
MALGSCRTAVGEHGGRTRPRGTASPTLSYAAPSRVCREARGAVLIARSSPHPSELASSSPYDTEGTTTRIPPTGSTTSSEVHISD